MKISCIIPCHNAGRYLGQTIGSLLEQSRQPDEIIVVDDGSTDDSARIASQFDDTVRLFRKRFGHAQKARNFGYTCATGEALMFMDADDVLGSEALAGLANTLICHPGAIALCPWFRLEQDERTGCWVRGRRPWRSTPGIDPLSGWLKGRYSPPCAVLWSRTAYEATGGWDESLVVNQDGDLMMRAMVEGIGIFPAERGEVFYRRSPPGEVSLSGRRFSREGMLSGIRVIEKIAWLLEIGEASHHHAPALAHAFRHLGDTCRQTYPDLYAECEKLRQRYEASFPVRHFMTRIGVSTKRMLRRSLRRILPQRVPARPESAEEIRYGLTTAALRAAQVSRPTLSGETVPPVPAVSVIIPTHNRAHLLPRAVRSVLAQTWHDLELIVVDDGSKDATADVMKGFRDSRIRFIQLPVNGGVSAARNRGLREARGDAIAFLDSDDEWLPRKLDRQMEVLRQAPDSVGLVYTGVESIREAGEIRRFHAEVRGDVFTPFLYRNAIHSGSSVVMRRNVIRSAGFFHEAIPAIEDYDYWVRVARFHQFEVVGEPLVIYHDTRVHDRKSLDLKSNLEAQQWFYQRYRHAMRRAGLEHLFLLDRARRHLAADEPNHREVRRLTGRALRQYPWAWACYIGYGRALMRSLLPPIALRWYRRGSPLKRA